LNERLSKNSTPLQRILVDLAKSPVETEKKALQDLSNATPALVSPSELKLELN
jgi:hypothetical protein